MRRQAATSKGLIRRIEDLKFRQMREPRVAKKVRYPLKMVMTALVVGMVTLSRSLRDVESRTLQIANNTDANLGITTKNADNTFGKVLPRVDHGDLVACLHRMVKAEHRRGNLTPTVLRTGTVAIDGCSATGALGRVRRPAAEPWPTGSASTRPRASRMWPSAPSSPRRWRRTTSGSPLRASLYRVHDHRLVDGARRGPTKSRRRSPGLDMNPT